MSGCMVEIISYKTPCVTIVTQGEFDETIATYDETNIVVIDADPDDATIALVI
jgi:hypothetical protein